MPTESRDNIVALIIYMHARTHARTHAQTQPSTSELTYIDRYTIHVLIYIQRQINSKTERESVLIYRDKQRD